MMKMKGMRRWIAALVVCAVLLSSIAMVFAGAEEIEYITLYADGTVTVYEAPDTESRAVTHLEDAEPVRVIELDEAWYETEDNTFIQAISLRTEQYVAEPEAEEAEPEEEPKAAEGPVAEEPVVEEETVEEPVIEEEPAEEAVTEEAVEEEPVAEEEVVAEEPEIEKETEEEIVAEEPVIEEETEEEVVAQEPVVEEEIIAEEPTIEEAVEEEPVVEEKIIAEEPAIEEAVEEEPVAEEVVVEEPAIEEEPEAAPAAEDVIIEAPAAVEEVTEAPAAEEELEEVPAAETEIATPAAETEIAETEEEPVQEIEEYETPLGLRKYEMVILSAPDQKPVSLHESADAASPVIAELEKDAEIVVIGVKGGWAMAAAAGERGYIVLEEIRSYLFPETGTALIAETEAEAPAEEEQVAETEPEAPTEEEQIAETEPEEDPTVNMKVSIYTNQDRTIRAGEAVNLYSKIEGFDGYEVRYQWICDKHDGNGFQDVEGANESSYSFIASAESMTWDWQLSVYYD